MLFLRGGTTLAANSLYDGNRSTTGKTKPLRLGRLVKQAKQGEVQASRGRE